MGNIEKLGNTSLAHEMLQAALQVGLDYRAAAARTRVSPDRLRGLRLLFLHLMTEANRLLRGTERPSRARPRIAPALPHARRR